MTQLATAHLGDGARAPNTPTNAIWGDLDTSQRVILCARQTSPRMVQMDCTLALSVMTAAVVLPATVQHLAGALARPTMITALHLSHQLKLFLPKRRKFATYKTAVTSKSVSTILACPTAIARVQVLAM